MTSNLAERLISARKMSGLSLQDLAGKLDRQITKQALNKYEHGKARPSSDVLLQIARVLHVPIDYFYRNTTVQITDIDFRKHTRLGRRDIERIKGECSDFLERYLELEDILNIRTVFINPLVGMNVTSYDDIENIVLELRKAWGLCLSPIPSVVEVLEDNGIKVFVVSKDTAFSGMSSMVRGMPVIVLNNSMSAQRKRFTALHELAHLLLDLSAFDEKTAEKFCHAFAGALLVPRGPFLKIFGLKRTSITVRELEMVDELYGISVQAIMSRARSLGVISEPTYRDFNIWLSSSGKKKEEFVTFCGNEEPRRFIRLLYKAVAENYITMSKAASLANKRLADFREEIVAVG
jgi:Zn-dependent peptidase ImmA (M78 family)/DNA-binding XRE family transcriptional regulator